MFQEVIAKKAKDVLALLGKQEFIKDFYLAGGTGLAMQFGHRISVDLDFFSAKQFNPKKLLNQLSRLGDFVLEKEDWGTVNGKLNGVKISFIFYQHKLLQPAQKEIGVKIASPIDIALMKITATGSRGSKKDFIDLYFICQKLIPLKELFALLPKKFKEFKYEPYHLIMGLTYFKDAEKEPMPKMLMFANWREVKNYFQKEVKKLV